MKICEIEVETATYPTPFAVAECSFRETNQRLKKDTKKEITMQ